MSRSTGNCPQDRGEAPTWLTVVTAVLAAATALFGYVLQGNVADLETAVEREQLALERQKFEADEKARRDRLLSEHIPLLMSAQEVDVLSARAVLFAIFPNEAVDILERASLANEPEAGNGVRQAVERAEEIARQTGSWAVLVGTAPDIDAANQLAAEAAASFDSIELYKKADTWFVLRSDLPTQQTAESVMIAVRSKFREDALVVNFDDFCPDSEPIGDRDEDVHTLCKEL